MKIHGLNPLTPHLRVSDTLYNATPKGLLTHNIVIHQPPPAHPLDLT